MITDAEFWVEVRRKHAPIGGDSIFKTMLALLHHRQTQLDALTVSMDREEFLLTSQGKERLRKANGTLLAVEDEKQYEADKKAKEKDLKELEKAVVMEENKALRLPNTPPRAIATVTCRVLEQIMLYAVPIYSLRYNVSAMSMGWNTSCFIDRPTKQLITFGAGQGVKVPQHLYGRGCVAGDGFFAILSDHDEVWASGGLKVSSSSNSGPTALGRDEVMTGIAGKTLMLVGHGQRLATVSRTFTVRPLSALSNPTRSIMPSRPVRFLDLGYGEDYYMVGTDSIVYKTTASKRAVSTPRRVMTLCRTPVSRIASGTSFLLIIDQNGHLYSLGRNKKGQLGNGDKCDSHRKPFLHRALQHHFFVQVAAGDCHSLALASNGVVYGAGSNESGQLGLGWELKEALVFTPIPLPCKCIGIAAGPVGSMFACADGQVLTCGLNDCMQLGVDTTHKIVCEPTAVAVLMAGVESYTMDFGGYRRPQTDPEPSTTDFDSPQTSAQQIPKDPSSAHAGAAAGEAASPNAVNSANANNTPRNNSEYMVQREPTIVAINDTDPVENHEPIEEEHVEKGPKADAKPKQSEGKGKTEEKAGCAKCCVCM